MTLFEGQPFGTGPLFPRTVLHFRLCTKVHCTQCVLPDEKMAVVDGRQHSVNRP